MAVASLTPITFEGLSAFRLRAADGAEALVSAHGAHVLSWKPAGAARERLYLSPRSGFGAGQAIRGGVPVIFPQFSTRGPGPRHGFARTTAWQAEGAADATDEGAALLRLVLQDTPGTRAAWDHGFRLALDVRVHADTLLLALCCHNTGTGPCSFTAALHTYLAVDDIAAVALDGLEGRPYEDNADGGRQRQQAAAPLAITGEVDRVYGAVPGPVLLREGGAPALRIAQQGFEDLVVWNPGAQKCAALADMPADGWQHMVCVEAARILRPVALAPGETWRAEQRLTAL